VSGAWYYRTRPHQPFALFVNGQALEHEFLLQIIEQRLIQIELALQGAVGGTSFTLQDLYNAGE
jgi:hypothetical protein